MFNLAEKFWSWKDSNKGYSRYKWMALAGFSGILRNEGTDALAGRRFIKAYESGVKSKDVGSHHMKVEFENGDVFNVWIENKMYAYGSGSYTLSGNTCTRIKGLLPRWVNLIVLEIEKS